MKVLCTFRLSREKVPLVETLAPAAEEQNSDVSVLVICLGVCSPSHCVLQVQCSFFPLESRWLLMTWVMHIHTFCLLCLFSAHNRHPHCLPSTWRKEERKGITHHRIIFYFVRKELASHECAPERWIIILREQGCFDGPLLCLAGRTACPEEATSKPGWREVCCRHSCCTAPGLGDSAGAQCALCYVFLSEVMGTSTCNWWGLQGRLKYPFFRQVIDCFWKSQWNFWWKEIQFYVGEGAII